LIIYESLKKYNVFIYYSAFYITNVESKMKQLASILTIVFLFFLAFEVIGFSPSAQAQTTTPAHEVSSAPGRYLKDIWTRDKLTGDWGGLRSDLSKHGIDIGLRLSQYWQRVASGGVDVNSEYGGTMDYRVNLDMHKLLDTWEGFSVNMHARTRFGYDVNADAGAFALQNTGMLMPAPDDYHHTDITGLTVNQYFPVGEGHLGLFTLGMIDVLDAVTLFFPHVGYGQEGFWNVNGLISALPWFGAVEGLSLYGGWLATINKEYQMGQSAILVLGTENVSTTMSWDSIDDSFEDGVWIAGFHRFLYKLDDKPGYFMIFAGASTKDQASNDPSDYILIPGQGIENTEEHKPWDIAAYVYQVFWQDKCNSERKATFFMGGTWGPDNPQFAQWNIFASLEGYGLICSRPHDRMGVTGWYNGLSNEFVSLASKVNLRLRDTWGLEIYYNFEINKWLHLSPDFQLIKNERTRDDIAIIPGFRLVVDF
jgi:porin